MMSSVLEALGQARLLVSGRPVLSFLVVAGLLVAWTATVRGDLAVDAEGAAEVGGWLLLLAGAGVAGFVVGRLAGWGVWQPVVQQFGGSLPSGLPSGLGEQLAGLGERLGELGGLLP